MLSLILVLAGLYAWQNALRARERARALGHEICAGAGVQLLDQSVTLSGVGFTRNGAGQLRVRRSYAFEISLDGLDRHRGGLQMLDGRLLSWSLPDTGSPGPTVLPPITGNVIAFRRSEDDGPARH